MIQFPRRSSLGHAVAAAAIRKADIIDIALPVLALVLIAGAVAVGAMVSAWLRRLVLALLPLMKSAKDVSGGVSASDDVGSTREQFW